MRREKRCVNSPGRLDAIYLLVLRARRFHLPLDLFTLLADNHNVFPPRHIRQVESKQESYDIPEGLHIVYKEYQDPRSGEVRALRAADNIAQEVRNLFVTPISRARSRAVHAGDALFGDVSRARSRADVGGFISGNLVVLGSIRVAKPRAGELSSLSEF